MKFKAMFLAACFLPAMAMAQDGGKQSIEEQVLFKSLLGYQIALAYNEACNKPPVELYKQDDPVSMNLAGNQRVIGAKFGSLQHAKNPEITMEELGKRMAGFATSVSLKAKATIDEKGCDSEEAKSGKNAWALYSKITPPQLNTLLNEKTVEAGGTVTTKADIKVIDKAKDKPTE
ncbi:MAG: hypothetical protein KTR28_07965 [Micavibrio sp.]|nr:hypothetical protein [Micavibrio sp.]